jgi:hypothetical protein
VKRSVTVGASPERINLIMVQSTSSGLRRTKRDAWRGVGGLKREDTLALAKVYSCSSRARDLLSYISFFIN